MTFDINSMKTDRNAENDGVWIDYEGGLRLKIARLNSEKHQQAMIAKQREFRKRRRLGNTTEISAEALRRLTCESMADNILLDWENMVEGGKAIEYSRAEAIRLLHDVPEFYRLVEDEATNVENFRAEIEENELGNLPDSGSGGDDGDTQPPSSQPDIAVQG